MNIFSAILVVIVLQQGSTAPQNQDVRLLRYDNERAEDGLGYAFDYETSDGTKRVESGKFEGNNIWTVRGSYSFFAPDGLEYIIDFIADDRGYRPTGKHLVGFGNGPTGTSGASGKLTNGGPTSNAFPVVQRPQTSPYVAPSVFPSAAPQRLAPSPSPRPSAAPQRLAPSPSPRPSAAPQRVAPVSSINSLPPVSNSVHHSAPEDTMFPSLYTETSRVNQFGLSPPQREKPILPVAPANTLSSPTAAPPMPEFKPQTPEGFKPSREVIDEVKIDTPPRQPARDLAGDDDDDADDDDDLPPPAALPPSAVLSLVG